MAYLPLTANKRAARSFLEGQGRGKLGESIAIEDQLIDSFNQDTVGSALDSTLGTGQDETWTPETKKYIGMNIMGTPMMNMGDEAEPPHYFDWAGYHGPSSTTPTIRSGQVDESTARGGMRSSTGKWRSKQDMTRDELDDLAEAETEAWVERYRHISSLQNITEDQTQYGAEQVHGDAKMRIEAVQKNLVRAGYEISVDGIWGPETERAFRHDKIHGEYSEHSLGKSYQKKLKKVQQGTAEMKAYKRGRRKEDYLEQQGEY